MQILILCITSNPIPYKNQIPWFKHSCYSHLSYVEECVCENIIQAAWGQDETLCEEPGGRLLLRPLEINADCFVFHFSEQLSRQFLSYSLLLLRGRWNESWQWSDLILDKTNKTTYLCIWRVQNYKFSNPKKLTPYIPRWELRLFFFFIIFCFITYK